MQFNLDGYANWHFAVTLTCGYLQNLKSLYTNPDLPWSLYRDFHLMGALKIHYVTYGYYSNNKTPNKRVST